MARGNTGWNGFDRMGSSAQAGHERAGGRGDALEAGVGLLGAIGYTVALQREVAKVRPQINQLIARHTGVLLVIRNEQIRAGIMSTSLVQAVYVAGGGDLPEPLVHKWRTQGGLFPAPRGPVEEVFVWVLRQKDVPAYLHRPPGMYPGLKDAPTIKFVPLERL